MRALAFSPSTLDREARTVEAIASTGAPVMRLGPSGPYEERLSLDAAHVDLSRLDGAPVLNSHRQASVGDVFGTVTASRPRERSGAPVRTRPTLCQFSRPREPLGPRH